MSEETTTSVDDLYDEPDTSGAPDTNAPDPNAEPPAPAASADPPASTEPPAPAAAEPPAGEGDPPPGASTDPPAGDPPADDNRPGIERWLADYGIEGGMIQFEDGEKVHINELDPKEQHAVLDSLAKNSRPTLEQLNDLNEDEVGFLNMVRESGKPVADVIAEMANQQLETIRAMESSQGVDWDEMEDDGVYLAFLKKNNPELEDAELHEDLEKAKETKTYESTVKGIRGDFKAEQERDRASQTTEINERFDAEIEDDRKKIVEEIAPLTEIAGFGINDDQKNALLGDILELNEVGDSLLLQEIFSTPQTIMEAAWFKKYGKASINQLETHYRQEVSKAYSRGRDEALGKMPESDIPARIGGLGKRADLPNNDGFGVSPDAKSVDDLYND